MRRTVYSLLFLMIGMSLLAWLFPRSKVLYWPVSPLVVDRDMIPLTGYLSDSQEWSMPVPLDKMGKWMPKVVVALEDRNFYLHSGVYLPSILRAAFQNFMSGRIVSGGSTISSQLIRIALPRNRTVLNKLIEFFEASILENFLTKDGILEIYLNRAPFGSNIRGVEAASRVWFNKPAEFLSLGESVLLVGLLRGPAHYRPDRYSDRVADLRDRLLEQLVKTHVISLRDAKAAKAEPVPCKRFPVPSRARFASKKVLEQKEAHPDRFGRVHSTIDINLQNMVENELHSVLEGMPERVTASAVLVENESGAVRAYVGNIREGSGGSGSWVDCADSPRSPGSTLKPFVYAAAFERGIITPGSLLADTPLEEGFYSPRNYDREFRGPVTVREALVNSLNIPAVRVFRAVGAVKTLDLYQRLGFSHFKQDPMIYGDNLVLGGCEVTALELASAYNALASDGRRASLVFTEGAKREKSEAVLTPAAAALTLDVLKDKGRLLPFYRGVFGEEMRKIAFKTGTSYGLRDGWTAAVTKKYTLTVWFGDPSGAYHKELVGINTAAKAAIPIMRRLSPDNNEWFTMPPEVSRRKVCALSGELPNNYCSKTKEELYIKDISSNASCSIHADEMGHAALKWPRELEDFFKADTDIGRHGSLDGIRITSVATGTLFILVSGGDRLCLEAKGGKGPDYYWFVDGNLIGTSKRGSALFWTMTLGEHTISAADEDGTEHTISITVKSFTEDFPPLLEG